jgi:hypothetical protein
MDGERARPGGVVGDCRGYVVLARDGEVGPVAAGRYEPDYLVVRTGPLLRRRHPVVPTELVERVDPARRRLYVQASRRRITRLPEYLPVSI